MSDSPSAAAECAGEARAEEVLTIITQDRKLFCVSKFSGIDLALF